MCFGVRETSEVIRIEATQGDLATKEHLAALRRQQCSLSLSAQRNIRVFYSWLVIAAHTRGTKKSTPEGTCMRCFRDKG